ncbi:MAG: hypothetical protein M1371_10375 [Actinobacteria bacterium]|nr:hypothetical protein [Actinomycetota bacterium]
MNKNLKQQPQNKKSIWHDARIIAAIIGGIFLLISTWLSVYLWDIFQPNTIETMFSNHTKLEQAQTISQTSIPITTKVEETTVESTATETTHTESTTYESASNEITSTESTLTEKTSIPLIVNASFSDNFNGNASSAWEPLSGTWRVINDAYTADPTGEQLTAYSMVGNLGWRDYKVDVDISVLCQGGYPIILLIRSLDPGNGMQMHIDCCYTRWLLYKNGTGTVIAEIDKGIPYECGTDNWTTSHVQIEATGSQYSMFLNGARILQVEDSTYSYGKSGVGLQCPFDCAV